MSVSVLRFVDAQNAVSWRGVSGYERAVRELERGRKRHHFMHWLFPQPVGLGRSRKARRYGIVSPVEAVEFAGHEVLGERLRFATVLVSVWAGRRSLRRIFGRVDAVKFVSSMTLFGQVTGELVFVDVLDRFGVGEDDVVVDWVRQT